MIAVYYSPTFRKMYKKLPMHIKGKAEKQEKIFRQNFHDPRLKTHRLSGKLKEYWAFSITHNYRIIFSFASHNEVYFHAIGTHEIYKS